MPGGHIVELSLNQLDLRFKKFRSCSDSVVSKMVESLRKRGQLTPLVVGIDNGAHVLLDGFKRYRAADRLRIKMLVALITPQKGSLMKSQVYLLNQCKDFSLIDEGLLIQELIMKDGLSQVEVGTLLGRHKSWVCRRLSIIKNLDPQIIEDIQLGLIPVGSAVWLAQLPRCNQGDVGSVIQSFNLGVKESKGLIDMWRKNPEAEKRKFLMDFPWEALQLSSNSPAIDTVSVNSIQLTRLLKTIDLLGKICDSLFRLSINHSISLGSKDLQVINDNLNIIEDRFGHALKAARHILKKQAPKEAEGPDSNVYQTPGELKEDKESSRCDGYSSGFSAIL